MKSLLSTLCVFALTLDLAAQEPERGPNELKRLQFRCIGPAVGGRVARSAGVPGDPLTYYAGTTGGGVWKSSDGGLTWKPIFDDQPIASIGSIAVAPSDPNLIYVGSGEANPRGNMQPGNGIYVSTDAGKSWKHVWKQRGQIGTMVVHPHNSNIAFAAVLGHAFGPNEQRGVYRTADGGQTWKQVLFKSENAGASDVCIDPNNPRVLFAGVWEMRRYPWDLKSGGPDSGLHVSRDMGETWTQLVPPPEDGKPEKAPAGQKYCSGLPRGIWGKVAVRVAPSDGSRVYALIEAEKGGLFRSDDGGESWTHVNDHRAIRQRAWYFSHLTVHPTNADVVYFPQVPMLKTVDGGKTLVRVKGIHHGDHHDIWIDPKDPNRMIDSNDGGVDITLNAGETWYAPPLPICQFYHIAVDSRTPYHVMGTIQDIGTASGPSNSLSEDGISPSLWHYVGGGEAGYAVPHPKKPHIVYAGEYSGYISRYDHTSRQRRPVSIYPYNSSGHGAEDLKYRFQWTAPILVSKHPPHHVYHAANVLFRSADEGQTWQKISEDLTRNDKSKQKWAGGPITGDNTGVEIYGTIFALAESPKQQGLIWAGTDDGRLHVTQDDGKTWTEVTGNIEGMPKDGAVVCVEASPHELETAYVVVERHRLDDMKPYLFQTADLGKTWTRLSDGLDEEAYLRVVREDPKQKGLLFVGTERGLVYSRDHGKSWTPLKLNLPTVAVSDLVIKDDDLVIGTNGRSIWVLDDLTPLRQMSAQIQAKKVHLFPPVPVVRWNRHSDLQGNFERWVGSNPPEGAMVRYWLKDKVKSLKLEVLDADGQVVVTRTEKDAEADEIDLGAYSEPKAPEKGLPTDSGLNRYTWDLEYQGATPIKNARTDGGNPRPGPVVLPGTYTLKLTADGETATTELKVLLDPRLVGPDPLANPDAVARVMAGLKDRLELALQIRDDITRVSKLVGDLRSVRDQLQTRNQLLANKTNAADLIESSKKLIEKLNAVEAKLHNPTARIAYDILAQKGGAQLYSQFTWLYSQQLGVDAPSTQGIRELYKEEKEKLGKYAEELQGLMDEVQQQNEKAPGVGAPTIVLP
jgi:photosystem II stability/assembly factor-like uncharacterized protein